MSIQDLIDRSSHDLSCAIVRYGGNGEQTQILCGSFQFRSGRENLILSVLPKVMIQFCRGGDSQLPVEAALRFIAKEAGQQRPGSEIVLSRMVEILFVQVLRHWLGTQKGKTLAHWLTALRDDRVAQALSALHAHPEQPWSLPFAVRFTDQMLNARDVFSFRDLSYRKVKVAPFNRMVSSSPRPEIMRILIRRRHPRSGECWAED